MIGHNIKVLSYTSDNVFLLFNRRAKRREQNRPLVDFINSPQMEVMPFKIYLLFFANPNFIFGGKVSVCMFVFVSVQL